MHAKDLTRFGFLCPITSLASGGNALAQHMNATDAPCQTAGSGAEETQCFISEARVADSELNTVYTQVKKILTPSDQNKLQVAQRLWVKFRDANCTAERGLYDGGSAAPMVYAACVAADTRQRTAELNTMYGWRLQK
jgi:uncharacterized protein YecT (DUF1311 family)